MTATAAFLTARDFLLTHREEYATAYNAFVWPQLDEFNWALDYFDHYAQDNQRPALWVVDESGGDTRLTFAELRDRSNRVANFFRQHGIKRGDRLLVMLPNIVPLWEVTLAAIKLGAVISPASTLLTPADLQDRIARGAMRGVIVDTSNVAKFAQVAGAYERLVVGGEAAHWTPYEAAYGASGAFVPDGPTRATDPLLLYFTSGTTAQPKLVLTPIRVTP
jgi:acetyl-CoA synthetase